MPSRKHRELLDFSDVEKLSCQYPFEPSKSPAQALEATRQNTSARHRLIINIIFSPIELLVLAQSQLPVYFFASAVKLCSLIVQPHFSICCRVAALTLPVTNSDLRLISGSASR